MIRKKVGSQFLVLKKSHDMAKSKNTFLRNN